MTALTRPAADRRIAGRRPRVGRSIAVIDGVAMMASTELRDEVDPPTLISELCEAVRTTIAPSFVGTWMRTGSAR